VTLTITAQEATTRVELANEWRPTTPTLVDVGHSPQAVVTADAADGRAGRNIPPPIRRHNRSEEDYLHFIFLAG
jgi:hypothetical protein